MATPFLYFFLLRKLYYFVALSLSEKLKKFTRAQLCSFLTKRFPLPIVHFMEDAPKPPKLC